MPTNEKRMNELLYSNEGRIEQCERICKLEKVAKELWLLLAMTENEDLLAEMEIAGKQVTINAEELRASMVDLGIMTESPEEFFTQYLRDEHGIEVDA